MQIRTARAHRALRNSALTSDGNTGLLLLVGVAKELDELSALQRDIRGALSDIVNDPTGRKKDEEPRLKKQKGKDLRLVKLQLQQNGTRLAEHFNRAQDIMSKVPRQITLTDIRWVEDNRATRQAIADGQLVELCRTQTPVAMSSDQARDMKSMKMSLSAAEFAVTVRNVPPVKKHAGNANSRPRGERYSTTKSTRSDHADRTDACARGCKGR